MKTPDADDDDDDVDGRPGRASDMLKLRPETLSTFLSYPTLSSHRHTVSLYYILSRHLEFEHRLPAVLHLNHHRLSSLTSSSSSSHRQCRRRHPNPSYLDAVLVSSSRLSPPLIPSSIAIPPLLASPSHDACRRRDHFSSQFLLPPRVETISKLAGNKRRSFSSQGGGGLLNRMFGSQTNLARDHGSTDNLASTKHTSDGGSSLTSKASDDALPSGEKRSGNGSPNRDTPPAASVDKKRRSSGVGNQARSFLASARNSLHFSTSPTAHHHSKSADAAQTPLQKLGRHDYALSVPQGRGNNSAGDSLPGPRSTFRVGVWEDKNKKCRRTMEDTHAFLYNFIHTPAPVFGRDEGRRSPKSAESKSIASSRGSTSSEVMETDNGYFAIFDGHAGTFAADWCGKKVHIILEDLIRRNPNAPIPEMLDLTFTSVDHQLENLPVRNSGCTAVCAVLRWEDRVPNAFSATGSTAIAAAAAALKAHDEASTGETKGDDKSGDSGVDVKDPPANAAISPGEAAHAKLKSSATRQRVLYTANVGDARIVLCRAGKALRLSYDHKGSDEAEGRRVSHAGGLIVNNRVNGVLAVTRALGDAYIKDLVTGHPYTTETVIQPDQDEFIILACDGLWDVCQDQEAVDLIRNVQDPNVAAKHLVDHALARFSTDNLSCMVVRLDRTAAMEVTKNKDSAIGVEGDPRCLPGMMTEVDKIMGEARRRMEADGECIGVSATNSGKGIDHTAHMVDETAIDDEPAPAAMESVEEEPATADESKAPADAVTAPASAPEPTPAPEPESEHVSQAPVTNSEESA